MYIIFTKTDDQIPTVPKNESLSERNFENDSPLSYLDFWRRKRTYSIVADNNPIIVKTIQTEIMNFISD